MVVANPTCLLKAPKDEPRCPYHNGTFLLTCDIPEGYPRDPPEVRFVTFILHPNVSEIMGLCSHCLNIVYLKVSKQGKVTYLS